MSARRPRNVTNWARVSESSGPKVVADVPPTVEHEVAFAPENLCIDQEEIVLRVKEARRTVRMLEYSLSLA